MRNQHGRVLHLVGPGLKCGAYQRFHCDVTLPITEPRRTLGQQIAAVDDTVDQPPTSTNMYWLPVRFGARIWSGECVGHHVCGSHDEQWPASRFGTQRVGSSGRVAGSDEHGDARWQAQSRGGGRHQLAQDTPDGRTGGSCCGGIPSRCTTSASQQQDPSVLAIKPVYEAWVGSMARSPVNH